MSDLNLFFLPDEGKYDTQISHLVTQLNYTRSRTLRQVKDLTMEQLDYFYDDKANSVGILLRHIAALEFDFQINSFERRAMNIKERDFWHGAVEGELYLRLTKGNELSYYLDLLEKVRAKTLEGLSERDDKWLYQSTFPGSKWNNYWLWFHQMEDECNHIGQMKIFLKHFKNQ